MLAAGRYHLPPAPFTDETCGNCEDPNTPVAASRGLLVKGKSLNIVGAGMDATIIHTHAGYGILFEDSLYSALQALTVTGGTRDPDSRASDAAVVVRRGQTTLVNVRIADNLGDPEIIASTVVGISGVAGREGSHLVIRNSEILRNSWDGIALYRQAHALIEGSLIDGVDSCRGLDPCGGRGVGIDMTWDARASVINTVVRRYWKGIGVFVDARAEIHGSLVEEMMTWGIAVWGSERGGRPVARMEDNIIYKTGACGASIASGQRQPPAAGSFSRNVIVATGSDPLFDSGEPYCLQRAAAAESAPPGFLVEGNILARNREAGGKTGSGDIGEQEFLQRMESICRNLSALPYGSRSSFYGRFCAPAAPVR
jgi:hypothetical protein